jgi:hypothetical protein
MSHHDIFFDGKRIIEKHTNRTVAIRVLYMNERRAVWIDPFGGIFGLADVRDFDEAFASHVQADLSSKKWTREALIEFLVWADGNGIWTDEDMKRKGWPSNARALPPLTTRAIRATTHVCGKKKRSHLPKPPTNPGATKKKNPTASFFRSGSPRTYMPGSRSRPRQMNASSRRSCDSSFDA